ncbi:hypothetical protein BXZ70DRAFT_1045629 [Cristinia sonorae]|uniref:Uncharacterized protein n=1 Tax=Cristinia sonorae TaxID=1940300 RepID=A0A8K0XLG4_9AGAR|nr:hypothetical protein BXZ70DRAFT_1045629 [Cristinia sonorae]
MDIDDEEEGSGRDVWGLGMHGGRDDERGEGDDERGEGDDEREHTNRDSEDDHDNKDDNDNEDDNDNDDEDPPHYGWEPNPDHPGGGATPLSDDTSDTSSNNSEDSDNLIPQDVSSDSTRARVESALRANVTVVHYPSDEAGAPLSSDSEDSDGDSEQAVHPKAANAVYAERLGGDSQANIYAPFADELEWGVSLWAKTRGPGSNAFSDLLKIPGFREHLGLSYKTSAQLNKIIDEEIPNERPRFQRTEIVVDGHAYEVYFRDVLECIQSLYGDPNFAAHLVFKPERHYADPDQTIRLYHDIYTGKWWWAAQEQLDKHNPGGTIIPVLVSSDKTEITEMGGQMAYPIYLTIGNLPKEIRRKPSQNGQILLGYLPTTKLEHITNKARRRRVTTNLFHACVGEILRPLEAAGLDGVVMTSVDGITRRTHPIFASYIGDYLEQVLVTGVMFGECPTCDVPREELGEFTAEYPFRDLEHVIRILELADTSPGEFLKECREAGIKAIYHPFWLNLPIADIFLSITPDILHQLYQGVVKHLISWLTKAFGATEIDARCRRLPPNHSARLFTKGITTLSKVTGTEHADMARIIMGLIVDLPLPGVPNPTRLVSAVRAILDFLYLAQYPIHSTGSLDRLDDALQRFHDNKSIFVDLHIREGWQIPKLHWLEHYRFAIEHLGTTDNFNTEYTERLHIDLTKDAHDATNGKDIYSQMTRWVERKEKMLRHEKFVEWRRQGCPPVWALNELSTGPQISPKMTKQPSVKGVHLGLLAELYGAVDFQSALKEYIVGCRQPGLSVQALRSRAAKVFLPFIKLPVYHKAKFWDSDFRLFRNNWNDYDVLHVSPTRQNRRGQELPGRFDTAIINMGNGGMVGAHGYEIGQVRVIFSIPPDAIAMLFPPEGPQPPQYLAYVEWFTGLQQPPDPSHGMFRLRRKTYMADGVTKRKATIIPLSDIRRSVMLFPHFGPVAPRHWTSENVLELCTRFYVNSWTDRHLYGTFY